MDGQVPGEAHDVPCQGDQVIAKAPGKVDPGFLEDRVQVPVPV